ncbi:MAG TPA: metal-dependent hydrolase [Acidisarcina sp.]
MEPITHFLTGACLSRAGCNRRTAYATLAMTLAAEAPDADILWRLRGPVAALQHHRGITHTLIAAPVVALVVTGAVWILDRTLGGNNPDRNQPGPRVLSRLGRGEAEHPVRWALVWFFSLLAVLSHLLLDFTNNYGIRPFFPFNPRWYSWDIVYVVEPVMLAVLALALIIPAVLGLADGEMGVRRSRFRGRGWAIAALVTILLMYALRNAEHAHAVELVRNANITSEPAARIGIEPYPIDPFKWFAIVQTSDYYQTALIHTRIDTVDSDSGSVIYKPAETPATSAAKASRLGRVYLDWAGFAVVEDRGKAENLPPSRGLAPMDPASTAVHFEDLRFAYSPVSFAGFNEKDPPLSGWVFVGPSQQIEATAMDGRLQK